MPITQKRRLAKRLKKLQQEVAFNVKKTAKLIGW